MQPGSSVLETNVSPAYSETWTPTLVLAVASLTWYLIVAVVCSIGYVQIWRFYSSARPRVKCLSDTAPHVTIIRPVKGLEPRLYECLASCLTQDYPLDRIHIRYCISDRKDPSYPIIEKLIQDHPDHDVQLLLEEEDDYVRNGRFGLGPNPKIRNMSRAYREAIGDIIWILDCNVWVANGVCGRMVGKLEGWGETRRNKFVHLLPLVVDIVGCSANAESHGLLDDDLDAYSQICSTSSASVSVQRACKRTPYSVGGGRLEEAFMASSHAKFYTAFQTVLVAPCIVGKSTMFRRSHLNALTEGRGIDHFSENICEDHLIGDLLWKQKVPEEHHGEEMGKHALCFGDLAVQPMSSMNVGEFWSRRVRWLRVRKFTVTLATLVEPGIEPLLCSIYGAFAATSLPIFNKIFGIPQTWTAFALFWLLSVSVWCLMDWTLYLKLHSGASIEINERTPNFAKSSSRRSFSEWVFAWLGRETLALPIWLWAVYGGTTVEWRGKKFRVGMDMKVHELLNAQDGQGIYEQKSVAHSKDRKID